MWYRVTFFLGASDGEDVKTFSRAMSRAWWGRHNRPTIWIVEKRGAVETANAIARISPDNGIMRLVGWPLHQKGK